MSQYPAMTDQPLRIREWPHPVLCAPSTAVKDFDTALLGFVAQMWVTMHHARGVGLAAPQVGVALRVFVMDCAGPDEESRRVVCVNPRLEERGALIDSSEGCLSFPGLSITVPRHETVTLHGYDELGAPFELALEGLDAICAQHELDHLDGLSFLDRLGPLERRATLEEYLAGLEDLIAELEESQEGSPEVLASMREAARLTRELLSEARP